METITLVYIGLITMLGVYATHINCEKLCKINNKKKDLNIIEPIYLMYDINYECRYYKDDVFIETDVVTDDEKEYIRNILYREDILNIFSIDENQESDIFDTLLLELYKQLSSSEELKECMKLSAARLISEDENIGLCILYSYDFMYLTHKCVCSFLKNRTINMDDYNLLKKLLCNK
jgi:hypothetical protein